MQYGCHQVMENEFFRRLVVLCLSILITACVQTSKPDEYIYAYFPPKAINIENSQMGILKVYNFCGAEHEIIYQPTGFNIIIDGKYYFLAIESYYAFELPPGEHLITATLREPDENATPNLHGGNISFKVKITPGKIEEVRVTSYLTKTVSGYLSSTSYFELMSEPVDKPLSESQNENCGWTMDKPWGSHPAQGYDKGYLPYIQSS